MGEVEELRLEVDRLKAHIIRQAKSKTLSVEFPTPENGNRVYVTAPWSDSESRIVQEMEGVLKLFLEVSRIVIDEDLQGLRTENEQMKKVIEAMIPVVTEASRIKEVDQDLYCAVLKYERTLCSL